jgi:hypothetical protein
MVVIIMSALSDTAVARQVRLFLNDFIFVTPSLLGGWLNGIVATVAAKLYDGPRRFGFPRQLCGKDFCFDAGAQLVRFVSCFILLNQSRAGEPALLWLTYPMLP